MSTKKNNNEEEGLDRSNVRSKDDLGAFLEKVDKQQTNGPFNIRDSGIVKELHKKLEDNAVNYDDEPVTACPHCESLYLKEINNKLECFNCGHEVEEKDVIVFRSIVSYLDREKDKD
jgi:hypothetical protein